MKRWISFLLIISLFFRMFCPLRIKALDNNWDVSDPKLLSYIQADFYQSLVSALDSEEYFVENVEVKYYSQEYIDELEFNSRSNIFFGYTLAELDKQFKGQKYYFTVGENNKTIVRQLERIDHSYYRTVKNLTVGTGVILICVTVSMVSDGIGLPAVSMIFSMAAETGSLAAFAGGSLGGLSAGIITGIQTGNMNEALQAAILTGSEGFKWGAISGAISGGITEGFALKGATLHGLTMNEAALIQKESGYPLDVIKEFQNMDQYNIIKEAGLSPQIVDNKIALIRNIDLNYTDKRGLTNLQLMQKGNAPLEPATGEPYQLHHIGQRMDSTLAILTESEHKQNGNNTIWHTFNEASQIDRNSFSKQRSVFWTDMYKLFSEGELCF